MSQNQIKKYIFKAFVHKDGELYELDGANDFPINHGKSTEETLLEVSKLYLFANIIKLF